MIVQVHSPESHYKDIYALDFALQVENPSLSPKHISALRVCCLLLVARNSYGGTFLKETVRAQNAVTSRNRVAEHDIKKQSCRA